MRTPIPVGKRPRRRRAARAVARIHPAAAPQGAGASFAELGLSGSTLRGVHGAGYAVPTPIQRQAVPHVLDGRDVVGCAQTGSGKTAAFLLPIIQNMADREDRQSHGGSGTGRRAAPQALILTPTRELAAQIETVGRTLAANSSTRLLAVYGGASYGPQARALRGGVDVLIATPGRLLDMMGRGDVELGQVGTLVLDEADRMLDMGFWPDVRRISAALPAARQSLFFSATMTREVLGAVRDDLRDPVFLDVGDHSRPVATVAQSVIAVASDQKVDTLVEYLRHHEPECTLVFTRTKRRADRLARSLNREGVSCTAIHGDRTQSQRDKALDGFRRRDISVLVATDVVARGIDVTGITHVINFDIPVSPQDYVHRIGRTARAGSSGEAVTLLTADDGAELQAIERLIGSRLERRGPRDRVRREARVHPGDPRDPREDAVRYMGGERQRGVVAGPSARQGAGMAQGTVKWFNGQKGYGFIAQEGAKDVFVHVNDLASGVSTLNENQLVEFEVTEGRKGPQAVNVRPV